MESLTVRRTAINNALLSLKQSLELIERRKEDTEGFEAYRDSSIKRLEFSTDAFWKYLKAHILDIKDEYADSLLSPRATFRKAEQLKIVSQEEYSIVMNMYEDRNKTSHTYEEDIAEDIFTHIPLYLETMQKIINRLKNNHE